MSIQDLDIKLMTYQNDEGGYGLRLDIGNVAQVIELINEFNDDFATEFFISQTIDNKCTNEERINLQIDKNGVIHNPEYLTHIVQKYPIEDREIIDLAQYMLINGIVNGDVTLPVVEGTYIETGKFEQDLVEYDDCIFSHSMFHDEKSFSKLIERSREYTSVFDISRMDKINKLEKTFKNKTERDNVYFVAAEYQKLGENDTRGSDVFGLGPCELERFHVLNFDLDNVYGEENEVYELVDSFKDAKFDEFLKNKKSFMDYQIIE